MRINRNRIGVMGLLALVLGAGTLELGGCATAGPGITNEAGTYVTVLDGSAERVTQAAKATCEDLKLTVIAAQATALDGLVEAKTAQDRSVTIKVQRVTDKASQVSVRVGFLGDGNFSTLILDKIKSKL